MENDNKLVLMKVFIIFISFIRNTLIKTPVNIILFLFI
jgi:hypothetical protein